MEKGSELKKGKEGEKERHDLESNMGTLRGEKGDNIAREKAAVIYNQK